MRKITKKTALLYGGGSLLLVAAGAATLFWRWGHGTRTVSPKPAPLAAEAVPKPAAAPEKLPSADDFLDHVACRDRPPIVAKVAQLDWRSYVNFTKPLRAAALERGSATARSSARAALVEAALLRSALPLASDVAISDTPSCPPRLASSLLTFYGGAEPGEIARLLAALRTQDVATRLVAANTLTHVGTVPDEGDIALVHDALRREEAPEVKFELIMLLATYAQRNKAALPLLRALLLSPATPADLAQRVAFELPGEDLRFLLFKDLEKAGGARPAAVRRWMRAKRL